MSYEIEEMFRRITLKMGAIGAFIEGVYDGLFYTYVNKGRAHEIGYMLSSGE